MTRSGNAALHSAPHPQDIQAAVSRYCGNVQQIRARLTRLKSNISSAITIGSVLCAIVLIWIGISQLAMLVYG